MATIDNVISANAALESAFANLAAIQAATKPKGYSGMSFALEEASDDGQQEAKKGIFQKLKDLIKRFFDFLFGRKKKIEDKIDDVLDKKSKTDEAFNQFMDEMKNSPDAANASKDPSYTERSKLVIESVITKTHVLREDLVDRISKIDSGFAWAHWIEGDTWVVADIPKLHKCVKDTVAGATVANRLLDEVEAAVKQGTEASIKAISDKIANADFSGVDKVNAGGHAKFGGSVTGLLPKLKALDNEIETSLKQLKQLQKDRNLSQTLTAAADKAAADGDVAYASSLRDLVTLGLLSLNTVVTQAATQLASMGLDSASFIMEIVKGPSSSVVSSITEKVLAANKATADSTDLNIVIKNKIDDIIHEIVS